MVGFFYPSLPTHIHTYLSRPLHGYLPQKIKRKSRAKDSVHTPGIHCAEFGKKVWGSTVNLGYNDMVHNDNRPIKTLILRNRLFCLTK